MSITEMAGGAFLWSHDARAVFIYIHGQHLGRAKLDTDMTTLTPGCIDKNLTARTFFGRRRHILRLAWNWNDISHISPFSLGNWTIPA
jgi:hypothetical protein